MASALLPPLSPPSHIRAIHCVGASASKPEVDLGRIERAVREILSAVGEDPDREGLLDTPSRVARAYRDLFQGLREDPGVHLAKQFEHTSDGDDAVVLRNIEFHSTCEHHLLPFLGRAHVAYIPGQGRVTGLSKLARTVDVFARRPQLQERMTAQIADALAGHLGARGVAVVVEGEHLCMRARRPEARRDHGHDRIPRALQGRSRRAARGPRTAPRQALNRPFAPPDAPSASVNV